MAAAAAFLNLFAVNKNATKEAHPNDRHVREIAVLGNASQNIATASYNSIYLMERPKDNGAKEGRPLHTNFQ